MERREYDKGLADKALQRDWEALREIRMRPPRQWQSSLLSSQDWEATAVAHFEGIFARDDGGERDWSLQRLRGRLLYMCNRTPVVLFSAEEIETAEGAWKRGRSTGPDKVPYETMKGIILDGEHWKHRLAAMYSDAMYKGHLPNVSDSVTTLLAKTDAAILGGYKANHVVLHCPQSPCSIVATPGEVRGSPHLHRRCNAHEMA